jgi:hypothetical protein
MTRPRPPRAATTRERSIASMERALIRASQAANERGTARLLGIVCDKGEPGSCAAWNEGNSPRCVHRCQFGNLWKKR